MSLIPQNRMFLTEERGGAPDISEWGQQVKLAGLLRTARREDRTVYGTPSGVHPDSPMFPGLIGVVGAHYYYSSPVIDPDLYYMGQVPFDAQEPAKTETAWDRALHGF